MLTFYPSFDWPAQMNDKLNFTEYYYCIIETSFKTHDSKSRGKMAVVHVHLYTASDSNDWTDHG